MKVRAEREPEATDASTAEMGLSKTEVDAYIANVKSEVDEVAQGRAQVQADALAKEAAQEAAKEPPRASPPQASVATSLVAKPGIFAQVCGWLVGWLVGWGVCFQASVNSIGLMVPPARVFGPSTHTPRRKLPPSPTVSRSDA